MADAFISEYRKQIVQELAPDTGFEEAEALSWLILQEALSITRSNVLWLKKEQFSSHHIKQMNSWIGELKQGRPWQYITGKAPFFGHDFFVDESVLIPRQETEELVDWIIRDQKKSGKISILDIGTGSGCIPITLAKKLPQAKVYACDISKAALETARRNASELNAAVDFFEADALSTQDFTGQNEQYDIIVSNPPYIAEEESTGMIKQVTAHEPHVALFVPDNDPLIFYRKIALLSKIIGKPGGKLYVEINERFGKETVQCFAEAGLLRIELKKDMQGKDRMIKGIF